MFKGRKFRPLITEMAYKSHASNSVTVVTGLFLAGEDRILSQILSLNIRSAVKR